MRRIIINIVILFVLLVLASLGGFFYINSFSGPQVYHGTSIVFYTTTDSIVTVKGSQVHAEFAATEPFTVSNGNRTIISEDKTPNLFGFPDKYYYTQTNDFNGEWNVSHVITGISIKVTSANPVEVDRTFPMSLILPRIFLAGLLVYLFMIVLFIVIKNYFFPYTKKVA